MIAWLKGTLLHKFADRIILDVNGVGYDVLIPFSTYYELGEAGSAVTLNVYTHVREDAIQLYGFLTGEEKRLFSLLIQVSGVGPRLAITALSGLPTEELVRVVTNADTVRLSSIPGIGKKTAERIILELKDKLRTVFPGGAAEGAVSDQGTLQADVVSALVNLGYARSVADKAVAKAISDSPGARFEDLLRKSLRRISG